MNLFPEQISAAGSRQLEAQFQLLGSAFDNVEKLMALHFDTTRQTLEQSSSLMRQVAAAKDPRDLFALANDGQAQLDSVLAYQRKLFGIASSFAGLAPVVTPAASAALEKLAALPLVAEPAPTPAPAPVQVVEVSIDAPVAELGAPTVEVAEPIAELTPMAEAIGHQEPHPSAAPLSVPDSATPIQVEISAAPAEKSGGRPKRK